MRGPFVQVFCLKMNKFCDIKCCGISSFVNTKQPAHQCEAFLDVYDILHCKKKNRTLFHACFSTTGKSSIQAAASHKSALYMCAKFHEDNINTPTIYSFIGSPSFNRELDMEWERGTNVNWSHTWEGSYLSTWGYTASYTGKHHPPLVWRAVTGNANSIVSRV